MTGVLTAVRVALSHGIRASNIYVFCRKSKDLSVACRNYLVMKLTRRDAVAALAVVGIGGGAVAYTQLDGSGDGTGSGADGSGATDGSNDGAGDPDGSDGTDGTVASSALLATSVALADVVYPAEVEGREAFVRTYVSRRIETDDARRTGMADAVATLDARAREHHDAPFRDLSADDGDALLRELGMQSVTPDPEGSALERVRFYLVNELLYALLTSPKGGALVDIENPPGHPGGLDAYQQGPQA